MSNVEETSHKTGESLENIVVAILTSMRDRPVEIKEEKSSEGEQALVETIIGILDDTRAIDDHEEEENEDSNHSRGEDSLLRSLLNAIQKSRDDDIEQPQETKPDSESKILGEILQVLSTETLGTRESDAGDSAKKEDDLVKNVVAILGAPKSPAGSEKETLGKDKMLERNINKLLGSDGPPSSMYL